MEYRAEEHSGNLRIEKLREKIDTKEYLEEAIQRIAQVLSNEIIGYQEGVRHEQ